MFDRGGNWNLPNAITVARLALVPVFVAAFALDRTDLAWWVFAIAGISDALDGALARLLKQRTVLGALLDPLADKSLLAASFICLAAKGWVPVWLAALVIGRDLIIVGGLYWMDKIGVEVRTRIAPVWTSKCNTMAQIALVFWVLMSRSLGWGDSEVEEFLEHTVLVLTVVTGAQYLLRGWDLLWERRGKRGPDLGQ
jgi:cardiolipin synthase (CMP-forming)